MTCRCLEALEQAVYSRTGSYGNAKVTIGDIGEARAALNAGPQENKLTDADKDFCSISVPELARLRAWEKWGRMAAGTLAETERRCERKGLSHKEISGALAALPKDEPQGEQP